MKEHVPVESEQAKHLDDPRAELSTTHGIEDNRPASSTHARMQDLLHGSRRTLQFQALQRVISDSAPDVAKEGGAVPDGRGVVQRVIFIGRSRDRVTSESSIVAEVARLARADAPDEAARIIATFDEWIKSRRLWQRFGDAAAVVSAIRASFEGGAGLGSASSSTRRERAGDSGGRRPARQPERRPERTSGTPSGARPAVSNQIGAPVRPAQDPPRDELRLPDTPLLEQAPDEPERIGREEAAGEPVLPLAAPSGDDHSLDAGDRSVASQSAVPRPDLASRIRSESSTRVGFEIEIGRVYYFPVTARPTLQQLLNRTLARYVITESPSQPRGRSIPRVVLEVLLDDIKTVGDGLTAQVEFRTPPLQFDRVNRKLSTQLRSAIKDFPPHMLTDGAAEAVGGWQPTDVLRAYASQLTEGVPEQSRFHAPSLGALAQHATTSIELAAFGRLDRGSQELLFPRGVGVKSKQALLNTLLNLTRGDRHRVDASTGGRNSAGATVKTPVESLLAADPALRAPSDAAQSGSVTVDGTTNHPYLPFDQAVDRIRSAGEFPALQGQGGLGYRAIAEKLQPPLKDEKSGELRVLVEHRSGGLVSAVNAALRGNGTSLRRIADAARLQDIRRRAPEGALARESTTTPRTTARSSAGPRSPPTAATSSATDSRTGEGVALDPRPPAVRPARPTTVRELVRIHSSGVEWAIRRGTFSAEFLQFRDRRASALQALKRLGLSPREADVIDRELKRAFARAGPAAAGNHPTPEVQGQIFDAVAGGIGRYLWALLRYAKGG